MDTRALRLLGVKAGQAVHAFVLPGVEAKLDALLSQGIRIEMEDWEIPFLFADKSIFVSVTSAPHGEGLLLTGQLISEQFSQAFTQLNASMQNFVKLNRQVIRQKRELEQRHEEAKERFAANGAVPGTIHGCARA